MIIQNETEYSGGICYFEVILSNGDKIRITEDEDGKLSIQTFGSMIVRPLASNEIQVYERK